MTRKIQRKKALDRALNEKLFKLGVSYGKQLRKIAGAKCAQDMATAVAMDIFNLNGRTAQDLDFNSMLASLGNKSPRAAEMLAKSANSFNNFKNDASAYATGLANKIGGQSTNLYNSAIAGVSNYSPQVAQFMAKYPKTTGLAVAAGIASALGGLGYGAYKLLNGGNNDKQNSKKKSAR
jgi:hypothetical protein